MYKSRRCSKRLYGVGLRYRFRKPPTPNAFILIQSSINTNQQWWLGAVGFLGDTKRSGLRGGNNGWSHQDVKCRARRFRHDVAACRAGADRNG